jgi:hypothetical protein
MRWGDAGAGGRQRSVLSRLHRFHPGSVNGRNRRIRVTVAWAGEVPFLDHCGRFQPLMGPAAHAP